MKPRLVVKVGTSTLTAGTNRISRGKIEDIARQFIELQEHYDIILVSSGAIATAKQFVDINGWSNVVHSKQAMSAIGQPKLIQIYSEVFGDFGLKVAQCLLTYRDFENDESRVNTRNTIQELLVHNYIPVVNENDTVAVEEVLLGDNDKLSALVAVLMEADRLIIASDIDGLFTKNPNLGESAEFVAEVKDLDIVKDYVQEKENGLGTGGMTSKISAVRICFENGIKVDLVNGNIQFFITKSLNREIRFTQFIPG